METLNGKLLNAKVVPSRKEQRQSPILMKLNVVSEKIFDTYFFIFSFFYRQSLKKQKLPSNISEITEEIQFH